MRIKKSFTIVLLLLFVTVLLGGCSSGKDSADKGTGKENPIAETKVKKSVVLYFGDEQAEKVAAEKRIIEIPRSSSTAVLAEAIVKELIKGPQNKKLQKTIPPEARLLSLKIQNSTAYVNFSEEMVTKHWGGSAGETMTIFSLVNSLTELKGIDKVQILINNQKQESLLGHYSTSDPFARNEDIIAP